MLIHISSSASVITADERTAPAGTRGLIARARMAVPGNDERRGAQEAGARQEAETAGGRFPGQEETGLLHPHTARCSVARRPCSAPRVAHAPPALPRALLQPVRRPLLLLRSAVRPGPAPCRFTVRPSLRPSLRPSCYPGSTPLRPASPCTSPAAPTRAPHPPLHLARRPLLRPTRRPAHAPPMEGDCAAYSPDPDWLRPGLRGFAARDSYRKTSARISWENLILANENT